MYSIELLFLTAIPGLFFVYFRYFYNKQQQNVKNVLPSFLVLGFEALSPPITIR